MKHLTYILLLLTLQLTASHNAGASTTVQSQDIIIIDKVEHKLNEPLLFQLDSATYFSLEEKLDFRSAIFSWNFRGHDDLTDQIKEMIVKEVNRVFNLFDWKTYSRDGEWHWLPTEGVTYPLIFNK